MWRTRAWVPAKMGVGLLECGDETRGGGLRMLSQVVVYDRFNVPIGLLVPKNGLDLHY